jgi:hypothetical protein
MSEFEEEEVRGSRLFDQNLPQQEVDHHHLQRHRQHLNNDF